MHERRVPSRASGLAATGIALIALSTAGCGDTSRADGSDSNEPVASAARLTSGPVEFERGEGSGEPYLARAVDGGAILTWLEPVGGERHALRLAMRSDGQWSEPMTVRESDRFFVNWADFPSAVQTAGGTLIVHWLEKVADAPYAYHVRLASSQDGGATWSAPITPHRDDSPTEHGFVSMVPWQDGAALAWLDGRAMAAGEADAEGSGQGDGHEARGDMSIRLTTLDAGGALGEERVLDLRTCECCGTAMASVPGADGEPSLLVAYRDRSPTEVRDIAIVRVSDRVSEPRLVAEENWVIPGCPVNGPRVSASGDRVAIAWFTGASGEPRVHVAFSEDGGETFGSPITVSDGPNLGRVDIELLDSGEAWVTWLDLEDGTSVVRGRRVQPDGQTSAPVEIARTDPGRASGFPRSLRLGDEILFAWTVPGEGGGIRVRSAALDQE